MSKPIDAAFWLQISKLTEARERGDLTYNELRERICDVGKTYGLVAEQLIERDILPPHKDTTAPPPAGRRKGAKA